MTLQQQQNSLTTIFLADDDEDDRILFEEALQEVNSDVVLTQAEDGKELLDILSQQHHSLPDVIFLDINMPKLDGFGCLQEIKQDANLKELLIIMLSTSSDPIIIEKAFGLGATFYAVKPNTFEGLKLLIKNVLSMDWLSLEQNRKKFRLT